MPRLLSWLERLNLLFAKKLDGSGSEIFLLYRSAARMDQNRRCMSGFSPIEEGLHECDRRG
jgi:hypothetical protein